MNDKQKANARAVPRDYLLAALLIAAFFCLLLGNRPLSVPDEGRYVEISREMAITGDYVTPRLNGVKYFEKPVLFAWLETGAIKLFGLDTFTLRLWPALFGLFGCLATLFAGAHLYGRRTGLIAAAVLATSLLYYGLSHAIILDMAVSVLLAAALFSFLLGTREVPGMRRRLYFWGFYAFSALAVLTKGLIGIVIPMMVIGAWVVLLGEWRLLRKISLPSGIVLFLAIAAPWHVLVMRANPEFFHFYFIQEHFLRYLTKMHHRYHPVWFFVPIVLVGLFPWSVFLVQAVRHNLPTAWRERTVHRDALFLMLWAGLIFLFFSASDSKLPPYILPIFPPLAILIGRYLADAWECRDFPGVRAGYTALLVTAVLVDAALVTVPYFVHQPAVQDLGRWPLLFGATLVGGSLAAWAAARSRGFRIAFLCAVVMSAAFLTEVNVAAPLVSLKSIKPIAMALKPLLRPGDEVATYNTYYQDLPVYLERRITIVNWRGELEFGTTVEDTSAWMIHAPEFWKRWQGPRTMYAVMAREQYEALRVSHPHAVLSLVAQDTRDVAVCNHEVRR